MAERHGSQAIAAVGSARNSLESQCMLKRICRTRNWRGPVFFFDRAKLRKTRSALENLDSEIAVSMREIEKSDFVIVAGADPLNEAGMAALAIRQAKRKGAPVIVIDPRPVFLPFEFEHIPASPGDIELYMGKLVGKAVEKNAGEFGKDAQSFYRAVVSEGKDREFPAGISLLCEHLERQ